MSRSEDGIEHKLSRKERKQMKKYEEEKVKKLRQEIFQKGFAATVKQIFK